MDVTVFADPIVFRLGPLPITRATVVAYAVSTALVLIALGLRYALQHRTGSYPAIAGELAVEWPEQLVSDIVGRPVPWLTVFSGTIFYFLAACSIAGQLPGVRTPTSNLAVTSALAALVFLTVPAAGIQSRGLRGYLHHYLEPSPLMLPLEFIERKDVDQPLVTGVMVIDAAVPIGRGQRELVIGDRNTGKTSLAIDFVAAQRMSDVVCVYVLIGQPLSRVLLLRQELVRASVAENTVIVAGDASMTTGLQYLAPYAGAAMAEAFRDTGRDALIVYDDLTKHADAYRGLALLLDRPPGREAFLGDIFYVHAELLERASARRADLGGGSVTAVPIVETTDSDLSGYIPTNLISITDGQIYLDPARHERNERPAVDVGRSVSRIGGRAQPEVVRKAARNLRILISRFEELEALARVGIEVDASTDRTIRRGRILRELLRQPRLLFRRVAEQVLTLTAVSEGWLDDVGPTVAVGAVSRALTRATAEHAAMLDGLDTGAVLDADVTTTFKACIADALPGTAT